MTPQHSKQQITAKEARAIMPKTRIDYIYYLIRQAAEKGRKCIEKEDLGENEIAQLLENGFSCKRDWTYSPKKIYIIQW